ncbi:peptidoglycan DD-metalloendopeptidase family protein [Tepidimonas sp.]|uniref:peptidoglycan DD-metalloendopeptidase family protein n=1 Tax=Tepidimonas sp. TaxID=2002775 RepID=UPI0028CE4B26|nr:peptidoglycan DD-metalloendopeptidase family protein [Tepidimonas sp.]MDT7929196.1 peptidoglycan DD-metalloendopeptidase family protein [Tepidimonas sp.]
MATSFVAASLLLAGCAAPSHPARKAPVVDRSPAGVPTVVPSAGAAGAGVASVSPPPGSENAGKPGYYTVRPGDTLYRIGLEHGQSWRDIAAWNDLANPNVIEVGQVLRVVPPGAVPAAASVNTAGTNTAGVTTQPVPGASVQPRPLDASPAAPATTAGRAPAPAATAAANSGSPPAPAASAPAATGTDTITLIWPAKGPVLYTFDEMRSKGIGIGGRAGDPVLAAADGRVVYAGSDLRGYGNLIILKHNNTYLTAYAHNQALLVREDQTVRQGQKIAEMGSSDADRVKLHFEVRRQGKPVDPLTLLPSR